MTVATKEVMTSERKSRRQDPSYDPWAVTPEHKKIDERILKLQQDIEDRIVRATPPCPVDGKAGKYLEKVMAQHITMGIYKCPDGHKFLYRKGTGSSLVQGQGDTPL